MREREHQELAKRSTTWLANYLKPIVGMDTTRISSVLEHRMEDLRTAAPTLYQLLHDIDTFHHLEMDVQRTRHAKEIEENILNELSPRWQNIIQWRYQQMQANAIPTAESIYKELLLMLETKKIVITDEEIRFSGPRFALQLQWPIVPIVKWFRSKSYPWFDGKPIVRKEISHNVLSPHHPNHPKLRDVINQLSIKNLRIFNSQDLVKCKDIHNKRPCDYTAVFSFFLRGAGNFLLETIPQENAAHQLMLQHMVVDGDGWYTRRKEAYEQNNIYGSLLVVRDF